MKKWYDEIMSVWTPEEIEILKDLYLNKKYTIKEIVSKLDSSHGTICKYLSKFGITRSVSFATFTLANAESKIFRDWLYKDSEGLRLTRKYNKAYSIDSLEVIQ